MINAHKQSGQALVALLVFTIISITIASAAIAIVLINSGSARTLEQGNLTKSASESGVENALIRLLRDPNYAGETLTQDDGDAIVEVSGGVVKTITSTASSLGFIRKIEVVVDTANYQINILSWKQIY